MMLTPETILGLIALFGLSIIAILMMLKKMGIIKFSNNSYCPDHAVFCTSFKELRDEHIIRGQTLKEHDKKLEEGKLVFNEIKKDIGKINTNIALIKQKLEIYE